MWLQRLGMESKLNGIEMRKFETKEDAMDTLKSWGINVSIALQEGLRIESVN